MWATASEFAKWVFEYKKNLLDPFGVRTQTSAMTDVQSVIEKERDERCRFGELDHEEIDRICRQHSFEHMKIGAKYSVEYADNDENTEVLEIPSLQVGTNTLRGRPDLVLKDAENSHFHSTRRSWIRR